MTSSQLANRLHHQEARKFLEEMLDRLWEHYVVLDGYLCDTHRSLCGVCFDDAMRFGMEDLAEKFLDLASK